MIPPSSADSHYTAFRFGCPYPRSTLYDYVLSNEGTSRTIQFIQKRNLRTPMAPMKMVLRFS